MIPTFPPPLEHIALWIGIGFVVVSVVSVAQAWWWSNRARQPRSGAVIDVDLIADALWRASHGVPDDQPVTLPDHSRAIYLRMARAVVELLERHGLPRMMTTVLDGPTVGLGSGPTRPEPRQNSNRPAAPSPRGGPAYVGGKPSSRHVDELLDERGEMTGS